MFNSYGASNKKCIHAVTKNDLHVKIADAGKRGWVLKGTPQQTSHGFWGCVIVRDIQK